MAAIEIQTTGEGKRLEWVTIYTDTNGDRAIEWGNKLVGNMGDFAPVIRILDQVHGNVIGAWQAEGYDGE